jgi:chromosome partitioning protein
MIIAIAHNKGGVGKTTLALNLAALLKPDIIIDQDTHQSLAIINNLRPADKRLPITVCNDRSTLISYLKESEKGKKILIDCGGFDSDLNRLAVAAATAVLIPANDDTTELIGLRRFDTVLAEISQEMDKHVTGHVILNRVHPQRRKFDQIDEFLQNANHMTRLKTTIARRKAYPDAIHHGLAVVEHQATKYGDGATEMRKVAQEILATF